MIPKLQNRTVILHWPQVPMEAPVGVCMACGLHLPSLSALDPPAPSLAEALPGEEGEDCLISPSPLAMSSVLSQQAEGKRRGLDSTPSAVLGRVSAWPDSSNLLGSKFTAHGKEEVLAGVAVWMGLCVLFRPSTKIPLGPIILPWIFMQHFSWSFFSFPPHPAPVA